MARTRRLVKWLLLNKTTFQFVTSYLCPIELNLTDSNQNSKGPGFWKMNVSLLEDPNYLEELKQNIPLWKTTGSDNLSDKRCIWDWLT